MESIASLNKMKVADLKKELKNRSLNVIGNKTELVQRLYDAVSKTKAPKPTGGAAALNKSSLEEDLNEEEILAGGTDDSKLSEQEEAAVLSGNAQVKKAAPTAAEGKENGVQNGDEDTTDELNVLNARSKRFGVVSSDATKKATRAERFGIPLADSKTGKKMSGVPVDVEQLKKRADRFGVVVAKALTNVEVEEKKKERASRFGITTPTEKSEAIEAAKTARAARFQAEEKTKSATVEEAAPTTEEDVSPAKAKKPRIVF